MEEMFEKKDVVYDLKDSHHLYQPIFKKITYGKTHLSIMVPISGIYYLMILRKAQA